MQSGLLVLDRVPNVGFRWLRNITTFLINDNPAFVEAHVNEEVNFTARTLLDNLEFAVGRKGFAGTVNAMAGIAIDTLNSLVDETVLVSWRNLTIEITGDVAEVQVEVAPAESINFVLTTLHLVTASTAVAA